MKLTFQLMLIALLAFAGSLLQAQKANGFKAIKEEIVEHTLDNGLKLIIMPRHDAPVFSFSTVVDVGSVDDPKGQTGMAHMFEHMAFKGTSYIGTNDVNAETATFAEVDAAFMALKQERRKGEQADPQRLESLQTALKAAQEKAGTYIKTNEFSRLLDRFGAVGMNASTGNDLTTYFYSLPSNKLELWMSLESERFLDPILREFYKEADVVKEERRMRVESAPVGTLLEEFLAIAYKAHPYGVIGVGHMSDLSSFTRSQAKAFYDTYYVPANITIAIVGDLDPQQVIAMAKTYFGRLPARPKPLPIETIEPPQSAERQVTVYGQGQNIVLFGYHIPDGNHPDAPVYSALSAVLSQGRTSRLYKRLVEKDQLALAAGGFEGFPGTKYPGLFLFYAFPNKGIENDQALAAMEEEAMRLTTELVSEEELSRLKTQARGTLLRSLSSNQGLANNLARTQVLRGDWHKMFDALDDIDAVTAQDLQRVALKTFVNANRTVGYYVPRSQTKEGGAQ